MRCHTSGVATKHSRSLLMAGAGGFALGTVIVAGSFLLWGTSDSSLSSAPDPSQNGSTSQEVLGTPQPSADEPTAISSDGPPPAPPSPPPTAPAPPPLSPSRPTAPVAFACSVQILPGPDGESSVLLVVKAPPEISTAWGVLTSDSDRAGGPISLVGGRGEQVVSGFKASSSQAIIYADPSMSAPSEACRSS